MLYSEHRLTLDIDLAVALPESSLARIAEWFPEPDFYTPPLEVLVVENKRTCRAHFTVIHVPSGLKADFYPSQSDAFFAWAWREKHSISHAGGEAFYAPPEYIIVWKVAYFAEGGGEKHVRDIRRMLEISGAEIDHDRLAEELARRTLAAAFQRVLNA